MISPMPRRAVLMSVLAMALIPLAATAADHGGMGLKVEQPWARATPGNAPNGAAYLRVVNHGQQMDRLVGATSPVSRKVELHTHTMDGGMMRMRQVSAVEVHPGEPAVFQPGGNHIMLIDLKSPLKKGESFPLTLVFDEAGQVTTRVTVEGVGSMGPGGGMKKMDHSGGHEH